MTTRSILLSLTLVFAACAPVSGPAGADAPALEGTSWTLASLSGQPPVAGSAITLSFRDGTASGSAGCNQYSAPYTVNGSTLTFGNATSTKRACVEGARNVQESAYLRAFMTVKSFSLSDGRLALKDAAGTTLAEFARAASAP